MGICSDKATTYLNRHGYNVVRVPRADLRPLQLIGQQKQGVSILGSVEHLITDPPGELPTVTRDQRAADMEGQETSKLDIGIGVNVLGTFIGAMGGNLGIKASYERAQKVQFSFHDVLLDRVDPLDAGNYLRDGIVDAGNPVLEQYVLGKGRLYLVTETIKTRKLRVTAERKDGTAVELDIPSIQGVIGGDVKVSADSERSSTITYEGSEYLVFGFRAFIVGVKNGELTMIAAGPDIVALGPDSRPEHFEAAILEDGGLLDLDVEPSAD